MRLVELFINETTEEDRAIVSLANVIYRRIKKYEDYIDPSSPDAVSVGKIGDFADTPLQGFEDINIELQQGQDLGERVAKYNEEEYEGKNPRGVWLSAEPSIVLNSDYISSERIKSTIVHELRHALDDLKSAGKANRDETRYTTPKKKEHRKKDPHAEHNYPYLAEPAELNGRFAQVLDDLIEYISKNSHLPPDQLTQKAQKALKRLFMAHKIDLIYPERTQSRDYKRLMKRAVDMINKEVAYVTQED